MLSLPEFLSRLEGVLQRGKGWMARCPAHDDHRQSLSVKQGAHQPIVLKCHAGCLVPAIVAAMGLTLDDISLPRRPRGRPPGSGRPRSPEPPRQIVAEYPYEDAEGTLLYQVVRFEPKDFRQRRPDPANPGEWLWNLDGTPRVLYRLADLAALRPETIVIPEGEKDVDALWAIGQPATCNPGGAGAWRAEYVQQLREVGAKEIIATPDNDEPGRAHSAQVVANSRTGGLVARLCTLPGLEDKQDVSDFLQAYGPEALRREIAAARTRIPLTRVHEVFARWLGPEYDLQVLDIVLAAAASHWLGGDPCWVMVVSGPGAAKTETIASLEGAGGIVVSTLTGVAALLSASAQRERARDATGGLLRQLGDNGILILKDMTSILSKDHSSRGELLSAIREIHDGKWSRLVGSEGGRRLDWAGRITMLVACTTAWDTAYEAISAMGDRFLLARFDSEHGRQAAFEQAQANNGLEGPMRRELAQAVGQALSEIDATLIEPLTRADLDHLFDLANLTTKVRTAVARDYREDVLQAHAAEMPTRFGKQLAQLVRGGMALGLPREKALSLAARAAKDSLPPLKWKILFDVANHPESGVNDCKRRLSETYSSIKRTLDALMVQGIIIEKEIAGEYTYTVKTEYFQGIEAISRFPVSGEVTW